MKNSEILSLCEALREAGERQGWASAPGLLAAVSGGSDSMALLELLRRCYGGRIVAAHLEHGFRGDASLADAAFVADHCRRAGVPCFVRHADVRGMRRRGESAEMAGRRARYEFFYELLEREGLSLVATGHTADDVAETMLFHLFRGAGLKGLAGIPPVSGRAVRPLIGCRREALRRFLADAGVAWREDETNGEDVYRRNRIRNQLLPWVRANLNAAPERALLGLAGQAAALEAEREAEARRLLPWLRRRHPIARAAWDAEALSRVGEARLAPLLRAQGAALGLPPLDRGRTEALCKLLRAPGRWRFQWSGETEVCGFRPLIGWVERADLRPPDELRLGLSAPEPGEERRARWGRWEISLRREEAPGPEPNGLWGARFPLSSGALRVRSLADLPGGDAPSIPWWSRPGWPAVENWIPGLAKRVQEESGCAMIVRVFTVGASGDDRATAL